MKEKVGGLEAKCDQYHSYITELREMIQSVKILQGPQRDTWEVFSTSCQVERPDISHFPGFISLRMLSMVKECNRSCRLYIANATACCGETCVLVCFRDDSSIVSCT